MFRSVTISISFFLLFLEHFPRQGKKTLVMEMQVVRACSENALVNSSNETALVKVNDEKSLVSICEEKAVTVTERAVCGDLAPTSSSLSTFWRNVDRSDKDKYALDIECFFKIPYVERIVEKIEEIDDHNSVKLDLVQCTAQTASIGYVYAAWNPLFEGLIKIGATRRHQPYIRVMELSGAGVPEPFQLVSFIACKDPFALERKIHDHFALVRKYGRKKEFFTISRMEIIEHFHYRSVVAMLEEVGGNSDAHKEERPAKMFRRPNTEDVHVNGLEKAILKRSHARTYKSQEEEDHHTREISIFVKTRLQMGIEKTCTTTQQIIDAYKQNGKDIISHTWFSKQLRKQISAEFPSVICKKIYNRWGYGGLQLK